jgi:pyruvate kinase
LHKFYHINDVREALDSQVDVIIDDGYCPPEPTTVIDLSGDSVEIGDPQLPAQQKRLIKLARSNDRIVITATQMLESMISNPIPTRILE